MKKSIAGPVEALLLPCKQGMGERARGTKKERADSAFASSARLLPLKTDEKSLFPYFRKGKAVHHPPFNIVGSGIQKASA